MVSHFVARRGALRSCDENGNFTQVVRFVCLSSVKVKVPSTFCRFELAMVLLFVVSYAFVARRKRRLLAIQHHRIAQYLS